MVGPVEIRSGRPERPAHWPFLNVLGALRHHWKVNRLTVTALCAYIDRTYNSSLDMFTVISRVEHWALSIIAPIMSFL